MAPDEAVDSRENVSPTNSQSDGTAGRSNVEGAQRVVRIGVLGPVGFREWQADPERAILIEIACYLLFHRERPIPGDELRVALRPDADQEISAKTLRSYMSLLRKALGPNFVPPGSQFGYCISDDVLSDWDRFRSWTGPEADKAVLLRAMRRVRGRPFAGVPAGTYGWVFSELLVSDIEVAIVDAAIRLVKMEIEGGDLAAMSRAARMGLLGVPSDHALWEYYVWFERERGGEHWVRAQRDIVAALGSEGEEILAGLHVRGSLADRLPQ